MKYYLLCLFLSALNICKAQILYEDLDKYSKAISEIQYRNQPFIIQKTERNFPEENFKIFFSTKLASHAYFSGVKQELILTEKADFAKVKSISCQNLGEQDEFIIVEFESPIEFTVVGEKTTVFNSASLPFYYPKNNPAEKKSLFESLSELILLFKKDKNPANAGKLDNEYSAWKAAIQKNTLKGYADFEAKYPGSVFLKEASNRSELISMAGYKYFFDAYRAGYNRSKKYLELWGNWKPGKSITEYGGKDKDIKEVFQTEQFRLAEAPSKTTYYNAGISFDIYTNLLDPFNNYASTNRNLLKLGKNNLFPRGIAINAKKEVVVVAYSTGADLSEFAKYLGYSYDKEEKRYSNSNEYFWFFDDCTIEFQIINGQYETSHTVRLFYHDRAKMIPNGSFTFNKDGASYEITPEIWKRIMGIK